MATTNFLIIMQSMIKGNSDFMSLLDNLVVSQMQEKVIQIETILYWCWTVLFVRLEKLAKLSQTQTFSQKVVAEGTIF